MPLTFSTDFDYWNERMKDEKTGEWLSRGDMTIAFLDMEGRQHPPGRHPARDHDQRLQGGRHHQGARPDQAGTVCRSDRSLRRSADRHRRVAQCAVRDEERNGVQKGRRDDAGEILPPRPGENAERQMDPSKIYYLLFTIFYFLFAGRRRAW